MKESNGRCHTQNLATLILVGQPNLRDLLRLSSNQAFYQRLSVRYHLPPLDLQNCLAYIKHHLTLAGCHGAPLFTDDAMTRIFDYTKGVPRQINLVCTTALLDGMIDKKEVIDEAHHSQSHRRHGPELIADLTLENGLLWQPVFWVVVLQFSSAFRLDLARPLTNKLRRNE